MTCSARPRTSPLLDTAALMSTLKTKNAALIFVAALTLILITWGLFAPNAVGSFARSKTGLIWFGTVATVLLYAGAFAIATFRQRERHRLLITTLLKKIQDADLKLQPQQEGATDFDGAIRQLSLTLDQLLYQRGIAEQRIELTEQRLQLVTDSIPALVAYVDADSKVILANRGYEAAYRIAVGEVSGQHVSKLLGDEVYSQSEIFIQEVLKGKPTHFERLVTHTGTLRWERVSYQPEFNSDNKVVGFISLAEDITELKRAQHTFARSEMRLRMITDNIPALIAYIDKEEHYIFCNGYYETMLGLAPDKILGQTVRQVAGDSSYEKITAHIAKVLCGQRVSFESKSMTHGERYFHTDFIPDLDAEGRVIGFYSMVLDITARKQAQLRQQTSERLLRNVTDNLPALISFIDLDERFQFNNLPYEKWFDLPLAEITGKRVGDLLNDADYARHQSSFAKALAGQKSEFEFISIRDDVSSVYQVSYLPQCNDGDVLSGVCVMINDISALKQVENQLRILARFDSLTGLPNRNQFDEKLADAIARSRRTEEPIALMFLDIDHFKTINDTLGHHAGDDVLREFALRLSRSVRQTDTVARLAGDEFVIILEGANLADQSTTVAQKIIDAMRSRFDIAGHGRSVSTSIGIAISHGDDSDGNALLRRADAALYRAKGSGRNRFCISP